MERRNFSISTKNIPVPSKREYMTKLLGEIERLVRSIRWKVFWSKSEMKPKQEEKYGLKSLNNPSPEAELKEFEEKLLNLAKSVKFRPMRDVNSGFQTELARIVKEIKADNNLHVPADKSSNYYKVTKAEYNNLLEGNLTKTYRKCETNSINELNGETYLAAQN